MDQTIPIYSGGLGILSGDHLKSASDLGIPLVAVGLLYKNGYFHQKINGYGDQETEYNNIELSDLPIKSVKDENGEELKINVKFGKRKVYLKVWQINVGRIKLYLLDSDIDENSPEDREVTLKLYGGDQEMRIKQEIVLGMGGTNLLTRALGLNPTVYHMNEGHSAFLILELIKNIIKEKKVSFEVAKDIASSKTVFTTHTPVPAGNDIFPIGLVEKYFKEFWPRLNLDREEFLKLGMKPCTELETGFNMGILALKVAGKKNGVSKLHGAVSRELFGDVWPEIAANESPITYVTNGIHTCSWLAPSLKELYNKYLIPYWQDNIYKDEVWENINNIPNQELWGIHQQRKQKLLDIVKESTTNRLRRSGYSYEEINDITSKLNPNALTIGFARRFATYKRATLIFRDLERITQILNNADRPVQLIFAGKAHPADKEGQDLIKRIHEISMMPQFKGKIFLLENYNIAMSRYLVSGVDIWLNNPRRPMEASGTSGQKASVNGVINFSVLDGWWAEGYNQENGWTIGTNAEFTSYEEQDDADSQSMYRTLEEKIIPTYYSKDENIEELAIKSVENLIEKNPKINIKNIDFIIVATTSTNMLMPGISYKIQKYFNIKNCMCLDILGGCAGFINTLDIVQSYITTGKSKTALMIGVDLLSNCIEKKDLSTSILLSDGAGAVIIQETQNTKIYSSNIKSQGQNGEILTNNMNEKLHMDGKEVYKYAVTETVKNINELLDKSQIDIDKIKYIILSIILMLR